MAAEAAWEAVIGLETHVQLGTNSKIFTSASTTFDSLQTPNTFPPENPALGLDFCWGCGIIHA